MNKTPKYLIAKNPLINNTEYIIHTRYPVIIAEVFQFDADDELVQMECKRMFETGSSLDYPPHYYVFGAKYVQENSMEPDKIAGIMRRMADWYETSLIKRG